MANPTPTLRSSAVKKSIYIYILIISTKFLKKPRVKFEINDSFKCKSKEPQDISSAT